MTAAVAGVSLVITTLEGAVLTPALMGSIAQMNHVTVFAGLLFWSWAWGLWGLLLAVPLMMGIEAVCDGVEDCSRSAACSENSAGRATGARRHPVTATHAHEPQIPELSGVRSWLWTTSRIRRRSLVRSHEPQSSGARGHDWRSETPGRIGGSLAESAHE